MAIGIQEKEREVNHRGRGTFELKIKWQVTPPHQNGLILQQVRRKESKQSKVLHHNRAGLLFPDGAGLFPSRLSSYWEAWRVLNGQLIMEAIEGLQAAVHIPPGAADDSFSNLRPQPNWVSEFSTEFKCSVYWLDAHANNYNQVYNYLEKKRLVEAGGLMADRFLPFDNVGVKIFHRHEIFEM